MNELISIVIIVVVVAIVGLSVLLTDVLSQNHFSDYPLPLKFGVKEEVYPDGRVMYALYYKRLFFWHQYMISPAVYCYMQYTDTYENVMEKVNDFQSRRARWRAYKKANRWWNHKIVEVPFESEK